MTNLEKRKMELEKEMREITVLEAQEEIRAQAAQKGKEIDRLLLNLCNQPLACGLPIKTVAHVRRAYDSKDETCATCFFYETCQRILALSSKKSKKGKRKNNGKSRMTIGTLHRIELEGVLSFQWNEGPFHLFEGTNWKEVTDRARAELSARYPLTTGQKQAVGHKGLQQKGFKKFQGL